METYNRILNVITFRTDENQREKNEENFYL